MLREMDLAEVYQALGQERVAGSVRTISMGALKTFGVYKAIKVRSRLSKLNRLNLQRAAGRLWQRVADGDTDLGRDLAQAILVSNIPLISEVLDFLEIEHDGNGLISMDSDHSESLSDGWADRVFAHCKDRFDQDLLLLYINYLGWETEALDAPFLGHDSDSEPTAAEPLAETGPATKAEPATSAG